MANLIRLAKSGDEWGPIELEAYDIRITFQDAQAFFDLPSLPAPSVHPDILNAPTPDDAAGDESYRLLEAAMMPTRSEESVNDFSVALLILLGYIGRPRIIRTRKELRFFTCGESKCAKPDICIVNCEENDIILLVQEDKRLGGKTESHARLIAEAIATFQDINSRRRGAGLDLLDSKIPVTRKLIPRVEPVAFPPAPTIVTGRVSNIPR
ncbi:hypothetical protein APHAL10511_002826 [Amanita phalloides]|nr:hypothetical protein APHAL10511_002826 [Amanita phalloides]